MTDWQIYPVASVESPQEIQRDLDARWLNPERCPPWRRPSMPWQDRNDQRVNAVIRQFDDEDEGARRDRARAERYVSSGDDEEYKVNLALLLRRPLLVRGVPGIGKSSLAYRLALDLQLGRPFRWEIHSTTTLQEGLYTYDAVGHFHKGSNARIEEYIRLGPLGTVLAPTERPACLLVDELDKASYDLPNDLLHAFEEGTFRIPELESHDTAKVKTLDGREVLVERGEVRCHHRPVVVVTSNDERDFPPAFLRRCVELMLSPPSPSQIEAIAQKWFEADIKVPELLQRLRGKPTDRILQALFLVQSLSAPVEVVERGLFQGKDE